MPWLPHGSCYPNNNTQLPGTSIEWGKGRMGSSTQGSAPSQAQEAEARIQYWSLKKQRPREAKDCLRVTQHFQGKAPGEIMLRPLNPSPLTEFKCSNTQN